MDLLKSLAFEAATTPVSTPDETLCGMSVLHAACIQRDVGTVGTILVLSPSELDAAIALTVPIGPKHKSHLAGKMTIELLKRLEAAELTSVKKIINKILNSFLLEPLIHAAVRKGTLRQVGRLIELEADINMLSFNVCCKPAFPIRVPHTNRKFVLFLPDKNLLASNAEPNPNSMALNEPGRAKEPLVFLSNGCNSTTPFLTAPEDNFKFEAGSFSHSGSSTDFQFEDSRADRNAQYTERVMHNGNVEEVLPSVSLQQVTTRLAERSLGLSWCKLLFRKVSPLHIATERQELQIMKLLISSGADVNIQDECGMTPLHLAARDGWVGGLRCLLLHGADVSTVTGNLPQYARFSYVTALHLAAVCEHPDTLRVLMEHGAVLDVVDGEGATPFHWACKGSKKHNAELFIERGCNTNGICGRMNGTAVCSY